MKAIAYSLLLLVTIHCEAFAEPQCAAPTSSCVDATPCKTISGVTACLSTATLPPGATQLSRDCWDTKKDYSCDLLQIDTCAQYVENGCSLVATSCAQTDDSGACTLYDKTYSCLTTTTASASSCDGIPAGCILKTSSCMTVSEAGTEMEGQCTATSYTYECPVPSNSSTTYTDCGNQSYCQGTLCVNASNKPNQDFGEVAAQMEIARQASKYFDPATMTVFSGVDNRCTIQLWTFGLAGDCCEVVGGAQSNNMVAEQLIGGGIQQGFSSLGVQVANPSAAGSLLDKVVSEGSAAAGSYASNIFNSASKYTYDVFFPGGVGGKTLKDGMVSGVQNLVQPQNAVQVATQSAAPVIDQSIQAAGTSPAGAFSNFSYYGFTISTTAPAAGTLSLGSMGSFNFTFDPWSFAAALALNVIMEALQCTDQEQKLMQMRGSNLCHLVGTYCSNELKLLVATICLEETQSFCCYNSKLARIINEQGRPQLPKGWGAAQGPTCTGFTMAELEQIDFSQMDLTEFIADLSKRLPDPAQLQQGVQSKVEMMYNNAPPF